MPFRYVPLLRSKTGEANALSHLSPDVRARVLPLIQVVTRPPAAFAARLGAAWAGRPLILDGHWNFNVTGNVGAFTAMFTQLNQAGVQVMPAIECDTVGPYLTATRAILARHARGLAVLSDLDQLANVHAWVLARGWSHHYVDLLIKLGPLGEMNVALLDAGIRQRIAQCIPAPSPWRSVTLVSGAAPKDVGGLLVGRTDVPRQDWRLWTRIHPHVGFQLDYGDYATAHPDLTEPPGAAMARATVSVRYTVENHWIVLKGHPLGGARGQPMDRQYRAHAMTLTQDPQFGGLVACHADQRIQQIAANMLGPGNRTTWVDIAADRHISLVADRLP